MRDCQEHCSSPWGLALKGGFVASFLTSPPHTTSALFASEYFPEESVAGAEEFEVAASDSVPTFGEWYQYHISSTNHVLSYIPSPSSFSPDCLDWESFTTM